MPKYRPADVLKYSRHDHMNELQIIKAYADLGHYDRIKPKIDQYIQRAAQESRMTALAVPDFVEWALTYNWKSPKAPVTWSVEAIDVTWADIESNMLASAAALLDGLEAVLPLGPDHDLYGELRGPQDRHILFSYDGVKLEHRVIEELQKKVESAGGSLTVEKTDDGAIFIIKPQMDERGDE
ncbi:Spo0B domain-containing protein [Bacillus daqingensis]|uniref:Spo0B domain-containing protein n=1 Tax=Bacillus daqingensis TaxID=872396 RepID=A0ABV9NZY9_9BACI